MEETTALGDKFRTIPELLDKEEFTAAFEMLDSLYKEYSSIEWVEDDEPSSVDNDLQQALHYLYKYFKLRLYALHDCRITRNVG